MNSIHLGLTDFLNHISRQPYHPTLVERYLSLAFEMPAELRRNAMNHLHRVLVQPNPTLALRCSYHYRRYLREESQSDMEEEIFVLQLIQACFRELGRHKQAALVGDEIARMSQELRDKKQPDPPAISRAYPRPQLVIQGISLNTEQEGKEPVDAYEKLGQYLFVELTRRLGSFHSIRHQGLAVEKLIHGLDSLYQKSGSRIAEAIQTYGRNPLIWNRDGRFRPELEQYLLNSRIFQMGKDQLTTLRISMIIEILTAYYDQRGRSGADAEEERSTRLRMLAEMIYIFLDAGVSFPSLAMGAS
jgi:hypothetical protein